MSRQRSATRAQIVLDTSHSNNLPEDKYVEILVVVDKTMFEKHGSNNVTTYALTLLNMVMIYNNVTT